MELALCVGPEVLGEWQPKGVGNDPPSLTPKTIVLRTFRSSETMSIPVYTNTKVGEVKTMLGNKLGVDPSNLQFIHKQGCMYRENLDCEEVQRAVTVKGIRSFSREKHEYEHPHCVIGAGHIGLKLAMTWLMEGYTNFVVFDRRPEVGGTSWWQQANETSRLQTEAGVYHLEYHENNGWPEDCRVNPWPTRNELLSHFKNVSEKFGILPYCRMNTDITVVNPVGKEKDITGKETQFHHYEVTTKTNGKTNVMEVASVCLFPGNLTNPKRVYYPGEETFQGDIVYGISNEFHYDRCTGKQVGIMGSGAFAVENVRTCVEFMACKVFLICRRRSMSMPRVVSWLCNQSLQFISAGLTLESMSPMYDLVGLDQWKYYCVNANESRTTVHMKQKSRFGIGDVFFLAVYHGYCEYIVDDIQRLGPHKIHLVSGRVLDNVPVLLKLLGFDGEFNNDKLMKLKELYGWWVNKDMKRYMVAEPLGVDANNFSGTSFSPGAIIWSEQFVHFLHYPKDYSMIIESGAMPTHVADESINRPAYVVDARHGAMAQISLGSLVPALGERGNVVGPLRHQRMWQMHPLKDFLLCAAREWDEWGKSIKEMGYPKPHPPYPYTEENVGTYIEKEYAAYAEMEAQMRKRAGL